MMYSRRAFVSPVKYMLRDIPKDRYLNVHVILKNLKEYDIPRITDCRETSDGRWIVFEEGEKNSHIATFLDKENVREFYIFYVQASIDCEACA
ncbi:hypothetical protein J2755_001541 [Methanohalophilus levihalophilus]|uniref:hypothetical protein n=1 Tax=Methanohalophilus levihalophilus TaxID=1431282 RepID=UPI001AE53F2B|nr:hypothetical protein [Methanohalophilus levihalophilus]MBP2030593.1 hypothetical protein [Methanohalophilus levihalophilus]